MLAEGRIVFDEVIEDKSGTLGTVTTYTSLVHSDFLADSQQLAFHAICQSTGAVNSLTIQIETSGDGRSWQNKQTVAEFVNFISSGVNSYTSGEPWPAKPNLRFVRLRLAAEDKASPFSLRVQLLVSSRTRRGDPSKQVSALQPAVSRATLEEVRALFEQERPRGGAVNQRVAVRLSHEARGEVQEFARRVRALSPEHRRRLAGAGLFLATWMAAASRTGASGG